MNVWITGASSGLGLHTAMAFAKAGHTVIAGARSFREEKRDGMYCFPLDVTNDASIRAFVEHAKQISGSVDCLVHCAGILMLGACEETTLEEYSKVMNTDLFGMVRMNQAVLPLMRAQGKGKIIMFSSINGLLGIPFQSAYTAAKHAVEGYAECLQMEVQDFGIQVCLVEPGDHRSGSEAYRGHTSGMKDDSVYGDLFRRGTGKIHHDEQNGSDPDRLGRRVVHASEKKHMPFRLRVASPDQHLAVLLHDILPPFLNHRILSSYYFGKKEKSDG